MKNKKTLRWVGLGWVLGAILAVLSPQTGTAADLESLQTSGGGYFERLVGISDSLLPKTAAATVEQTADGLRFSQDVILRGSLGMDACRAFQIWGNFYAGGGNIKPDGFGEKIKHDLDGTQLGLTLGLGNAFSLSGYYNYNDSSAKYNGAKNSTSTHLGGLGLRYNLSGFYFSLLGNYGDDCSTLKETDGDHRSLDYDGWQATGFFETGFQWPTSGRLFVLTPFSNFQYSSMEFDGFNRAQFTTTGKSVSYDAFYQTLGSRIDLNLPGCGMLGLQGRLAWVHQYLGEAAPINNYQFGRIPGTLTPISAFYEGNGGRDWFWGGIGAKLSLFNLLSATLDYDVLLNAHQTTHVGSVGLMIGF